MTAPAMVASNWRLRNSNTLKGFFDLRLPSGIVLHDCSLHQSGEKRWVGLPGKPVLDKDGKVLITPKTGRRSYSVCVSIPDVAIRDRFQEAALAALARLLGGGTAA